MSSNFKIPNLSKFVRDFKEIPKDTALGAKRGMEEALEIWEEKSRNMALKKTGDLRAAIDTDPVQGNWLDLKGTIRTDVYNGHYKDGSLFNYAAFWHERGEHGLQPKHPTTAGTVGNHLQKSGEDNAKLLVSKIRQNVLKEWRDKGW